MGREDDAVRKVEIDTLSMTSKSTTACDSMAFASISTWEAVGTQRSMNWVSDQNWLGVDDWHWMSGRAVTGWCNESSSSMDTYWAYRRQMPLEDWVTIFYGALGGGLRTRTIITVPTIYGECYAGCTGDCYLAGNLCLPNTYGFGIAAGGVGSSYHLRTGVVYDIIR
jgi:hypothetical protein